MDGHPDEVTPPADGAGAHRPSADDAAVRSSPALRTHWIFPDGRNDDDVIVALPTRQPGDRGRMNHMDRWSPLLGVLVAACGRLGFEARVDGIPVDGTPVDATRDTAGDAVLLGPWGAPQPLTALNSVNDDSDPELRGDGLELVFHSSRPGGAGGYDLYRSVRASLADAFSTPVPMTTVNTTADELGPSLSADGLIMYFSNGQDIVFATRTSLTASFTGASPLPALSSADVDTTPELSRDGLVAMVTRGTVGTRDMWIYQRAVEGPPNTGWSTATRVAELASAVTDCSPDLDQHGLTVYFHSDRMGTTDDIFIATRAAASDPFGPPTVVDVVSSSMDEGDPTLTADQRTIVFHRQLDLYMAIR